MDKSAENWMRSNLELLPVINVKGRPRYISAQKISTLGMIEIEILLTFVYFLECAVVQCKDILSIY
jgi:hypothetical protein